MFKGICAKSSKQPYFYSKINSRAFHCVFFLHAWMTHFSTTVAPVAFKISRWDKNNPPKNSFETYDE